eukprot:jgi/Bigna1/78833/fgenesh1_pg.57_\
MADSNAKYGVLAQQQQGPPPANAPAYVHAHQEIGVSSAPHQHQHQMIYSQQGQAGGGYMQAPVQYNVANNYNTPAGAPASHSAHHPQQYIPTPHQYQPTGSSPGGAVPVQSAGGYSGAAYTGDEGGGCGGANATSTISALSSYGSGDGDPTYYAWESLYSLL